MAYMPFLNAYPLMYVPYVEYIRRPSIESDAVLLLIVEVIDYSLRYHNLHNWAPTWDLDFLRMNNAFTYFNENFAATVISPNTEEQAIRLANSLGFNIRRWLELNDHEEVRRCQEYYLLAINHYNKPLLFQMFSFACYASRMALQRNRNSLVNDVAWALLLALRKIIPYEEYYGEYYFVANMYDNRHVNNQPFDDDEGIGDTADADNRSWGSNGNLNSNSTDPIVLFVKEVIDYSLRYNSFHGLNRSEDLQVVPRTEMRYFDEHLGRTITHYCSEQDAIHMAYGWGFNEETWLQIYIPSEARNYQTYFLEKVFHPGDQNLFRMLSFACYTCKIAKQRNRDSLVDAVVWALGDFLHRYFPYRPYYRELTDHAIWYNNYHYYLHSQSDDEGLEDIESEDVASEENNGADNFEEGTASDNDENEAEARSNAQSLVGEDEEKEESGSDVSEKSGSDVSEESGSDVSEESGSDVSEESEIDASIERSEIDASIERSEIDDLVEDNGMHTLEGRSEMHTLKGDS